MERLSNQQIFDAGLSDWRKMAQGLYARYAVTDYTVAAAFLTAVASAVQAHGHHPDLRLSRGVVDVSLCTHEDGLGPDDHDTPRQRWHFDLWLAPEVAEQRIGAAVAAGGSVVDDSEAPAFTVLADSDGNRVCVCTAAGR